MRFLLNGAGFRTADGGAWSIQLMRPAATRCRVSLPQLSPLIDRLSLGALSPLSKGHKRQERTWKRQQQPGPCFAKCIRHRGDEHSRLGAADQDLERDQQQRNGRNGHQNGNRHVDRGRGLLRDVIPSGLLERPNTDRASARDAAHIDPRTARTRSQASRNPWLFGPELFRAARRCPVRHRPKCRASSQCRQDQNCQPGDDIHQGLHWLGPGRGVRPGDGDERKDRGHENNPQGGEIGSGCG